jgi:hypothetical protein
MGGQAKRQLKMLDKLIGPDSSCHNVMFVTTMWDVVQDGIGSTREQSLTKLYWGPYIRRGARHQRYFGDIVSAEKILRNLLGVSDTSNKDKRVSNGTSTSASADARPDPDLRFKRELVEHKALGETGVGKETIRHLTEIKEVYQEELKFLDEYLSGGSTDPETVTKSHGNIHNQSVPRVDTGTSVGIAPVIVNPQLGESLTGDEYIEMQDHVKQERGRLKGLVGRIDHSLKRLADPSKWWKRFRFFK